MRNRATFVAIGVLTTFSGWSGCRASQAPEKLFTEAENLRLAYEKTASQQAIARYRDAQAVWERRVTNGRQPERPSKSA